MHYDLGDTGMSLDVPFGHFNGGDLVLGHPFNYQIPFKRGMIIAFQANIIPHWNLSVESGENVFRFSMVLFTCRNTVFWSNEKKKRELED